MKRHFVFFVLCCIFSLPIPQIAFADELPADVLVRNRWMELTHADYESALRKLPPPYRSELAGSPKRVQDLLNSLLVTKTLAAEARLHGVKPAAVAGTGPGDDADRALAAGELLRIDTAARKTFDSHKGDYERHARELYAVDRDKYQIPEAVRLSDITIAIKDRGEDAALARAREARERIRAGGDFATVAREYSDDAKTRDKGGALPFLSRSDLRGGQLGPVFAMKPGEISEPIKMAGGYHIVRLDEHRPARPLTFEEALDSIMGALRGQYMQEQRQRRIEAIYRDPQLQVNQAQVDALVARAETSRPGGPSDSPGPHTAPPAAAAPK